MAKAYASAIIPAPIDKVWSLVRDFNSLPAWHPAIVRSEIEDGRAADAVGCVRSFHLADDAHVREQLVSLDDANHRLSYNFVKPAFPVTNYLAWIQLTPITSTGETFAEWGANFDEAPEDAGKYEEIVSVHVFAAGWTALAAFVA
ncbi:SRPBCC family protein [Diaphorobacter caeni]|uniref:SRPBCC family protein n=1 Tax=Diaphorobacter caeni TaxID=2784387 RepID=UPI0018908B73|nr:SRPBCC family protein [Diaphorobacter caeni]MBF5003336.1 SRPBCC family protein [Diaphorobacter caeni]